VTTPLRTLLARRLDGALDAIAALREQLDEIEVLIETLHRTAATGGIIATCGNGGSAAEALHLAEELVGRYRSDRAPLRALCLNADPTALTCIANDFGFSEIFARQVRGLLRRGDCLVVFSTSGRSENLLRALTAARELGVVTIGLLGRDGGDALRLCTHALVVSANDSAHIQEAHQVLMHFVCESFEASVVAVKVGSEGSAVPE